MKRLPLIALGTLLLPSLFVAIEAQETAELPTGLDRFRGRRPPHHSTLRFAGGGSSLYFHQNMYTPEGDKIIFNSKGGDCRRRYLDARSQTAQSRGGA